MTPRDSDDLLRNITAPGRKPPCSLFLPPPPPHPRPLARARRAVCAFHSLVLTFLLHPIVRYTFVAREMSIESVTLKNPLTRLKDRPYNFVGVIVDNHRRRRRRCRSIGGRQDTSLFLNTAFNRSLAFVGRNRSDRYSNASARSAVRRDVSCFCRSSRSIFPQLLVAQD